MQWLKDIPDKTYIRDLSIPGTHNSCSYEVDYSKKVNNKYYQLASDTVIFQKWLTKWVKCQNLNIIGQLNIGVRLLDIRVSTFKGEFYTSHSYACTPLIQILDSIYDFLTNNPTEFIIAQVNTCPHIKHDITHSEVLEYINKHKLIRLMNLDTKNNLKVGEARGKLLIPHKFNAKWFNTSNTTKCLQKTKHSLNNIHPKDLYGTKLFMTPQPTDIALNVSLLVMSILLLIAYLKTSANKPNTNLLVLSIISFVLFSSYRNSVEGFANKVNKHIRKYDNMRIVLVDFIDKNTAKYVYSLNFKNNNLL
jgi:hypothetical protein